MSYWGDGDPIDYGDQGDEQPSIVECKRCGKGGLSWEDTDEGWILVGKNGAIHRCPGKTADEGDFMPL